MAVPTISSIAPTAGTPTGGQIVEIVGTGFRLPTPPVAGSIPVPPSPPSVRALVGGVAASVAVLSGTRLAVTVPKRSMPISSLTGETLGTEVVDITVENIDDAGVLIPGETVTIIDAYTYFRPSIQHDAPRRRVMRATDVLVDLLRSEVLANTVISSSTDYDPNTGTAEIEIQRTPQLVLEGPTVTFNAFFTSREEYLVAGFDPNGSPGERFRRRRLRVVDLDYELIGVTNSTVELQNLIEVLELVIDRNVEVPLECNPGDGEFFPLELRWIEDPRVERQSADPGLRSDLRVFRSRIQLRGLPITDFVEVPFDAIKEVGAEVETTQLEAAEQIGDNLPTAQGGPVRSPPDQSTSLVRPPRVPRRSPPNSGSSC